MSLRLLPGPLLAALVGAGSLACSGAAPTDLFDPVVDQNDTTPGARDMPEPTKPEGASAPDEPSAGDGEPDEPDEPDEPKDVCTAEAEPNDNQAQATPFAASLCGSIDRGRDIDFGRFVAPANATRMTISHNDENGRVAYRVFVSGLSMRVEDANQMRVLPGATYFIRMSLAEDGARPTYEVKVAFE